MSSEPPSLPKSEWSHGTYPTQRDWLTNFIKQIDIKGSERILDLGCGDGKITVELATRVTGNGYVLGIDSSRAIIDQALQLPKIGPCSPTFQHEDVLEMRFENQFDRVVSFNAFQYFKNQKVALENIYRALVPNGKAFIYFHANHGRRSFFLESYFFVRNQDRWKLRFADYLKVSSPAVIMSMIEDSGLLLGRMEFVTVCKNIQNRTEFSNWLKQWLFIFSPPVNELSEEEGSDFINGFIDKYFSLSGTGFPEGSPILYKEYMMELIVEKGE